MTIRAELKWLFLTITIVTCESRETAIVLLLKYINTKRTDIIGNYRVITIGTSINCIYYIIHHKETISVTFTIER